MIQWKKQPQEVIILLCAMLYTRYAVYTGITSCPDARKIYRAYKRGLNAMTPENRFYFDPYAVLPTDYSIEARAEADRIFYENF